MSDTLEHREPAIRLSRDLIKASSTMTTMEARYLVDAYYLMQDDRKRAHNQVRAMEEEPHSVIGWLAGQSETRRVDASLESGLRAAVGAYAARLDAALPIPRGAVSCFMAAPSVGVNFGNTCVGRVSVSRLSSDSMALKKARTVSRAAGSASRRVACACTSAVVSSAPDAAAAMSASSGIVPVRKYDRRDAIS